MFQSDSKLDALLVQISASYIHFKIGSTEPQLGQYYIAEYAKKEGFDIKIKKYTSCEPIASNLIDLIRVTSCRVLGFYVDNENLWVIRRLLIVIRTQYPSLFIVLGGPQATGDPSLVLKRIPQANCVIVGEGERPMVSILKLQHITTDQLANIKGLAYILDKKYVYTGKLPEIKSLDEFPYPKRKDFALDEDLHFDQIITGRGCVGACTFCFEGSKKNNVLRFRSLQSVLDEIDYVISNLGDNKKFITFLDDTFVINRERAVTICNHLIKKYDGKIGWYCEARVDILKKNIDLLPLMKKAGLIRVQLGGESGNQDILDLYKKNMKIEDIKYVVSKLYEFGIPSIYINYIIGGANETLETFNQTLELSLALIRLAPGCVDIGCSLFVPYVGTPIRKTPEQYGIKLIDPDLIRGSDGCVATVETQTLSQYKIMQLRSIYENKINQEMDQIIYSLTNDQIANHFLYRYRYGMATAWYDRMILHESIANYYEAIYSSGYIPFIKLTNDEMQMAVPFRTTQPISDGEKIFRAPFRNQLKEFTKLEEAVYLLSSGKLAYFEIIYIIKNNELFSNVNDLEERVKEIYENFDKERVIIWKVGV